MSPHASAEQVLVAEDDAAIRRLISVTLQHQSVPSRLAVDGGEAIAALEQARWRVLVLDLMMPRVDGWDVLRWIESHPDARPDSVIVVSAADRTILQQLDPTLVNAIIFKPFDVSQLSAYVKSTLELPRTDQRRARVVRTP